MLCPESRMYQLELAGLEIFHKLYFPERSPSFLSLPLSRTLFFSPLYSLIILSSPKTTCADKPLIYTLNKKEFGEKGKREWEQKRKRPFPPLPHSLYFVLSCGREVTVPYQGGESRRTKRKQRQKISQQKEKGGGRRKAQEK